MVRRACFHNLNVLDLIKRVASKVASKIQLFDKID